MTISEDGDQVILCDEPWFDAPLCFDCGQSFRFTPDGNGSWRGIAMRKPLSVTQANGITRLYPCTAQEFETLWRRYFDLDRDYDAISSGLVMLDQRLAPAKESCRGMRLLRQERFETLISFIISANNNISRIRGLIERVSKKYGSTVDSPWGELSAFPTPDELAASTVSELHALGAGYRDEYIADTARKVADDPQCLDRIASMDLPDARRALCAFKGVGPKVADCVLLFSMDKRNAFPKDVWVKRAASEIYGMTADELEKSYGDEAGFAQQMLFQTARTSKKK